MAEPLPSPSEKTVIVNNNHLCRLWSLVIVSLGLNVLILVLLVIGAIIHHHQMRQGFGGRDGRDGGRHEGHCQFGGGRHFHHFGGSGWSRQGGFGGGRFGEHRGDGFRDDREEGGRGFGDKGRGARGFRGGPGGPAAGMSGMPDMMPGGQNGPPDPARMTDMILNHLTQKLTLTDDEKAKIKPIIQQQVTEIQKQMEAQRQTMQKQMEDAMARIKPLLTADQQKQLEAIPLPGQKPAAPDEKK